MTNTVKKSKLRKSAKGEEEEQWIPSELDWGDLVHPERRLSRKGTVASAYEAETGKEAPYSFRKPLRGELRVTLPLAILGAGGGGIAGYLLGEDAGAGPVTGLMGGSLGAMLANVLGNSLVTHSGRAKSKKLIDQIKEARRGRTLQEQKNVKQRGTEGLEKYKKEHLDDWSLLDYMGGIPGTAGRIEGYARSAGKKLTPNAEKDLGVLLGAVIGDNGMTPSDVSLLRDKLKDRYV